MLILSDILELVGIIMSFLVHLFVTMNDTLVSAKKVALTKQEIASGVPVMRPLLKFLAIFA